MNEKNDAPAWVRRDDVAIASFLDGDAAFQAADCRLLALNGLASEILSLLRRPCGESDLMKALFEIGRGDGASLEGVRAALVELERLRLIKRRVEMPSRGKEPYPMSESKRYLANPDVSCRIEDDEGALLYNPDTQRCQVVNAVGLELWQCLSEPRGQEELAAHLCERYDGATAEMASRDVEEFIGRLGAGGFVGDVEGSDKHGV